MTCVICLGESVREYETVEKSLGRICAKDDCRRLVWEGHLLEKFGGTSDEKMRFNSDVAAVRAGQSIKPEQRPGVERAARVVDKALAQNELQLIALLQSLPLERRDSLADGMEPELAAHLDAIRQKHNL